MDSPLIEQQAQTRRAETTWGFKRVLSFILAVLLLERKVMVGDREDPQKLKRIAAASYDYDNDPRWAEYWTNILIPPNMAARSEVIDHFKRKFYQRYIVRTLILYSVSLFFLFASGFFFCVLL